MIADFLDLVPNLHYFLYSLSFTQIHPGFLLTLQSLVSIEGCVHISQLHTLQWTVFSLATASIINATGCCRQRTDWTIKNSFNCCFQKKSDLFLHIINFLNVLLHPCVLCSPPLPPSCLCKQYFHHVLAAHHGAQHPSPVCLWAALLSSTLSSSEPNSPFSAIHLSLQLLPPRPDIIFTQSGPGPSSECKWWMFYSVEGGIAPAFCSTRGGGAPRRLPGSGLAAVESSSPIWREESTVSFTQSWLASPHYSSALRVRDADNDSAGGNGVHWRGKERLVRATQLYFCLSWFIVSDDAAKVFFLSWPTRAWFRSDIACCRHDVMRDVTGRQLANIQNWAQCCTTAGNDTFRPISG